MTDDNKFPAKVISLRDPANNVGEYNQVIINRGKDNGIKQGQRFLVYAVGEEMFDPDTNESLGNLEIVKGTGTATHVQEKITTLTTDQYKKVPRRVPANNLYNLLMGLPKSQNNEYIEEFVENKIPFINISKGDFVRPI
jgi:hypothetical protein